jgi:hypothetical protein
MKLEESFRADRENRRSLVELLDSTNKFSQPSARQSLVTEIGIAQNRYPFRDSDAHVFAVELIDFLIQGGHHSALNRLLDYLDKEIPGKKDKISQLRSILEPIDPCELEEHYKQVVDALMKGQLVVFLGADVNLCDRQQKEKWDPTSHFPPIDLEVAGYLSEQYRRLLDRERELVDISCPNPVFQGRGIDSLPEGCPLKNLQHITQFIDDTFGSMNLYESLGDIFKGKKYLPNKLHQFIPTLPKALRHLKSTSPVLIITTNYDETLELALSQKQEKFDSLYYIAKGEDHGKFRHILPSGESKVIDRPETYISELKQNAILLKLYGTGHLVLTQDQIEDYPSDFLRKLPIRLQNKLKRSNILFIGCNLKERKDRSIVRRIWKELGDHQQGTTNWWVIQQELKDRESWENKYSSILVNQPFGDYIDGLNQQLCSCLASKKAV